MGSAGAKTIVIVGTLDTKGQEIKYVKDQIEKRDHNTLVVDAGVLGEPSFMPDISSQTVARAAGKDLAELVTQKDTATAVQTMMRGMVEIIKGLYAEGRLDGIMSVGGGKGTAIGTAAMRELPLGVPKVAVCTSASGDTRRYVGSKDIIMFPSITDIVGLNRVNSRMMANAVGFVGASSIERIPVEKAVTEVVKAFKNVPMKKG